MPQKISLLRFKTSKALKFSARNRSKYKVEGNLKDLYENTKNHAQLFHPNYESVVLLSLFYTQTYVVSFH